MVSLFVPRGDLAFCVAFLLQSNPLAKSVNTSSSFGKGNWRTRRGDVIAVLKDEQAEVACNKVSGAHSTIHVTKVIDLACNGCTAVDLEVRNSVAP